MLPNITAPKEVRGAICSALLERAAIVRRLLSINSLS